MGVPLCQARPFLKEISASCALRLQVAQSCNSAAGKAFTQQLAETDVMNMHESETVLT